MTSETVWLIIVFLSTLSLRRATCRNSQNIKGHTISIHALLAESDLYTIPETLVPRQFLSTLSLRRATPPFRTLAATPTIFLSTLSLRRATAGRQRCCPCAGYFYPRSPCGERPGTGCGIWHTPGISIHALLAESDPMDVPQYQILDISIHALLAESD